MVERDHWRRWALARGLDPSTPTPESLRRLALSDLLSGEYERLTPEGRAIVDIAVGDARRRWAGRVVEHRLAAKIDLSEAAIANAFVAEPERWRRVELVRLSHLSVDKSASPVAARDLVFGLYSQLRDGANFSELAKRHSQAQNAFLGGAIGWTRPDRLAPAIARAVTDLEPGAMSEPIETEEAWLLVRLEESRATEAMTLEEATPRIRLRLQRLGLTAALAELDTEARRRWPSGRGAEGWARESSQSLIKLDGGGTVTYGALSRFIAADRPAIDLEELPEERVLELAEEFAGHYRRELFAEASGWLEPARWAQRQTMLQAKETLSLRLDERVDDPSEPEVRAMYESHRERLGQQERSKLSTLRIDRDPTLGRERLTAIEQLVGRLQGVEDPLVAARRELDPEQRTTRLERRGWLDETAVKMLGAFVAEAAHDIQPGELRGPIVQEHSIYLVYCEARRGSGHVRFEDVEELIRRQMVGGRRAAVRQTLFDGLLGGRDVVLADDG